MTLRNALAPLALTTCLALGAGLPAAAGEARGAAEAAAKGERHAIALAPPYAPGDAYVLSLRTTSDTRARSNTGGSEAVDEELALAYRATVRVLEVDDAGRPVREVHQGVELAVERDGTESTFLGEGTAYEVRRGGDGSEEGVRLFVDGERVRSKVERLVSRALERQFEHTLGPKLFAPGREVAVGERWALDPELARRFLEHRGLRVLELGEPATASLRRNDSGTSGELVIDYAIPVEWLELERMPEGTRPSKTSAKVEGAIRVPADPRHAALEHRSELVLDLKGALVKPGASRAYSWSLESTRSAEQSTRVVQR